MNANDDHLLDCVHLIEDVEDFVRSPTILSKHLFREEDIVAVVHVKDRVFLQRVLIVTRRDEHTEAVFST